MLSAALIFACTVWTGEGLAAHWLRGCGARAALTDGGIDGFTRMMTRLAVPLALLVPLRRWWSILCQSLSHQLPIVGCVCDKFVLIVALGKRRFRNLTRTFLAQMRGFCSPTLDTFLGFLAGD